MGRVIASAPGRAGIIGNPTDGYGGTVISSSLAQRARVVIEPGKGLTATIAGRTMEFGKERRAFALADDPFDCLRAIVTHQALYDLDARIEVTTEIPVQAGLAGSTAVMVSLLAGIRAFLGKEIGGHYLAELAREIELHYLKVQCGYQDQYMAVFGGLNYMDFREKENYLELRDEVFATVEPLADRVRELPFLVVHTGVKRVSGQVLKPVRDRWLEGDPVVRRGYERAAHLARVGKRALLEGNWRVLGQLMNENHRIQQEIGASGPENDRVIEAALAGGALGAKLSGAGGGGTIIALATDPEPVLAKIREIGELQVLKLSPGAGVEVRREG
ncbi:MAG: hypothetical protein V2A58_11505 [Planctomycetota bacterium]